MDEVTAERWRPVVGYEDLYAVSDLGRVKSFHSRGRWKAGPEKRLLSVNINKKSGYATVALCRDGHQRSYAVHVLVLEAFVRPCPPGMECRHRDGNRANAALSNLEWGTSSENNLDQVRHGTHNNARKTHCKWNHEFTPANTYIYRRPDGSLKHRACRKCIQDRREKRKAASQAT